MAEAVVGKIKAIISADTTGFTKGVATAQRSLTSLSETAETTSGKVAKVGTSLHADEVKKASDSAAKSLDTLGKEAEDAAKQLEDVSGAVDGDELKKEIEKAERPLKELGDQGEQQAGRMNNAFVGLGGTLATVFATTKLIQFTKQAVSGASDLGESMNVTREIFESGSDSIIKFSKTAATQIGQSQKVALDGANTFATFGKAAGLSGQELSDFAIQFSTLASDLASFRNTTPEDAIQAIGAALRGETEPIRRYGVMINEAYLKQEALRMGIIKSTKDALTPQQKVMAASAVIMAQTSDAQGDFARTSDGLANSSRILKAQIEDLKAGMGEALLPTVQALVGVINPLVGGFNSMDESTKSLVSTLALLTAGSVLAYRGLQALKVEMVTAAGVATTTKVAFMGMWAAAAGVGIGLLIGEGINKLTGATEKANAAVERLIGTLGETGTQFGTIEEFTNLAKAEASTWRLGNAWEMFGKEVEIAGQKFDVEDYDRAFTKLKDLSTESAQQVIDRLRSMGEAEKALELDTGVETGWQDYIYLADRYQAQLDTTTAATDVLNGATGEATDAILSQGDALAGTAEDFEQYRMALLGAANVGEAEFANALAAGEQAAINFVRSMSDGKVSAIQFESALADQVSEFLKLQFATKGATDKLIGAVPALRVIMESMYRAGDAQGYTREQTKALIESLGLLDGIDPRIAIYLTMDVSQLQAQVKQLEGALAAARRTGNMAFYGSVFKELQGVKEILSGIQQIDLGKALSSGGGGGRSSKPEAPNFDWVEGWVNELSGFVAGLFGKDFADRLVSGTAPQIADALNDVIDEAFRLGVNNLAGGPQALQLVSALSRQLQAASDQLRGSGGLYERLKAQQTIVKDLEKDLADLTKRYAEFGRTFKGVGEMSPAEQLESAEDKLKDLKGALDDVAEGYRDWQQSMGLIEDNSLEAQLEREKDSLESLRSELDRMKGARADYARSTAESVGKMAFNTEGNVLTQAKEMLAGVTTFRDTLASLRSRGFPPSIISEVVAAGIQGGTALGKHLLGMSDADLGQLMSVQQEIAAISGQAGEIAASVLFDTDISNAESAFNRQRSAVDALYNQALAAADQAFKAQIQVVDAIFQQVLASTSTDLNNARANQQALETAISDLEATMRAVAQQIADALNGVTAPLTGGYRPPPSQTVGGGGMGSTVPVTPIGRIIDDTLTGGVDWDAFGRLLLDEANKLVPGQSYPNWNVGPLPNGGAIVGPDHVYLPPGLDFSGWMADGGIATGPAIVGVGEAGPEAIVPLSALGSMGGNVTINVTAGMGADGYKIAQEVVAALQTYQKRNGSVPIKVG